MKRKSKLPRNERRSVIKAKVQAEAALLPKPIHLMRTDQLVRQWRRDGDDCIIGVKSELRKRQVIR